MYNFVVNFRNVNLVTIKDLICNHRLECFNHNLSSQKQTFRHFLVSWIMFKYLLHPRECKGISMKGQDSPGKMKGRDSPGKMKGQDSPGKMKCRKKLQELKI